MNSPGEPEFVGYVRDQMMDADASAPPPEIRRMFGGHGVFRNGLMFALIADDALYFKADDETVAAFEEAGSEPFTYMRRGKPARLRYYSAPEAALEDPDELCRWMDLAAGAAIRNPAKKRKKRS